MAVGSDNKVRRWNLTIPDANPVVLLEIPDGRVSSAAFSPDLRRVAVGIDKTLRIWDLRSLRAAPILVDYPDFVGSIDFSADGNRIVSVSNGVRLLDLTDPVNPQSQVRRVQMRESISAVNRSLFSPDLQYLALGIDKTARFWDVRNPEAGAVSVFQASAVVTSMAFSPDSRLFAAGSLDKTVRVWNIPNPGAPQVFEQGHDGPVVSVAFSKDSSRLASVSLVKSIRVVIRNLRQPARSSMLELPIPRELPENCIQSLTFSPDLNRLACGGDDGRAMVWDLQNTSNPLLLLPEEQAFSRKGDRRIDSLTFSPDGMYLASSSVIASIRLWDLRRPLVPPKVLLNRGKAVAFSADGARIISGLDSLSFWDVRNPAKPEITLPQETRGVESLRLSTDGLHVAVYGGLDGGVQVLSLWSAAGDYLCTRIRRNLSIDEWQEYVGPDMPYEQTCPSLPAGIGARPTR
jgi:WD40 repeat protein